MYHVCCMKYAHAETTARIPIDEVTLAIIVYYIAGQAIIEAVASW